MQISKSPRSYQIRKRLRVEDRRGPTYAMLTLAAHRRRVEPDTSKLPPESPGSPVKA